MRVKNFVKMNKQTKSSEIFWGLAVYAKIKNKFDWSRAFLIFCGVISTYLDKNSV